MDFIPISPIELSKTDINALDPLALAFVGDAVHTLAVRSRLATKVLTKTGKLHSLTSLEVCAKRQSEAILQLLPLFTEEELSVFRRGKNAKILSPSKNTSPTENHNASGFEAVLGYLYLTKQHERLYTLLDKAYPVKEE